MLKDRLEATRTELQEREVLVQQIQSDLQDMAGELQACSTERNRDLDKMDKVRHFTPHVVVVVLLLFYLGGGVIW